MPKRPNRAEFRHKWHLDERTVLLRLYAFLGVKEDRTKARNTSAEDPGRREVAALGNAVRDHHPAQAVSVGRSPRDE